MAPSATIIDTPTAMPSTVNNVRVLRRNRFLKMKLNMISLPVNEMRSRARGSAQADRVEESLRSHTEVKRADVSSARSARDRASGRKRVCAYEHPRPCDHLLSATSRKPPRDKPGRLIKHISQRSALRPHWLSFGTAQRRGKLIPATSSKAFYRRCLVYPLASLDVSGQWPVSCADASPNEVCLCH